MIVYSLNDGAVEFDLNRQVPLWHPHDTGALYTVTSPLDNEPFKARAFVESFGPHMWSLIMQGTMTNVARFLRQKEEPIQWPIPEIIGYLPQKIPSGENVAVTLYLEPPGVPIKDMKPDPALFPSIVRHALRSLSVIHFAGYVHCGITSSTLMVDPGVNVWFNGLQRSRPFDSVQSGPGEDGYSADPLYSAANLSLPDDKRTLSCIANDIESLIYVLVEYSTSTDLPWKGQSHKKAATIKRKFLANTNFLIGVCPEARNVLGTLHTAWKKTTEGAVFDYKSV